MHAHAHVRTHTHAHTIAYHTDTPLSLLPHVQAVTSLDFHPTVSVLASSSRDGTVKFFDYSKPSVKRSYRALHEVAPVRSIIFHPSGDYMLVGSEHPTCESPCESVEIRCICLRVLAYLIAHGVVGMMWRDWFLPH